MARHSFVFCLFLKGGHRMCAIHAISYKIFFTPVRLAGKYCFLGLIGFPLLFGFNACSRTSEGGLEAQIKETPRNIRLTYRVVPQPAQRWVEGIGKLRAGDGKEKILVVELHELSEKAQLEPGQKIEFKVDRFPDTRFKGAIINVQDIKNLSGISVSIRVATGLEHLNPDDFFLIHILQEEKSMLAVPQTALLFKEGRFYVYLLSEGQIRQQEVRPLFLSEQPLFAVSPKLVAIAGIKEGDEVLMEAIAEESA